MIFRFRIILDNSTEEDIFRDIEIRDTDNLEDLHNVITQSFGFDGSEMASFYTCDDEWNQEDEEISLFDLGEGDSRSMGNTQIDSILSKDNTKIIYVYDFLNMWTFFVELAEIVDETEGQDYPNLLYVHGQIPDTAPDKNFESTPKKSNNGFEDVFEDEVNDEFNDGFKDYNIDDIEDLGFDENWN